MYADGHGLRSIARALNHDNKRGHENRQYFGDRKVPPPRKGSGSWAPSAIRAVLRNPLYRGHVVWGRFRNVDRDGHTRVRDKEPETSFIVRDVPELRIIAEELSQAVERRFRSAAPGGKRITAPTAPVASVLSGFASCGLCGGPIVLAGSRKRTRCYGCGWRVNRGTTVCPNVLLASAPAIDRQFLEAVEGAVFTDEARRYVFDRAREMLAGAEITAADDQKHLREKIRRLDASTDALLGAIEAGQARQVPEALPREARRTRDRKEGCRDATARTHSARADHRIGAAP